MGNFELKRVRDMRRSSLRRRAVGLASIVAVASLLAPVDALRAEYPRLMRYLSVLPGYDGRACFGHVLEQREGIPLVVANLGTANARLCADSVDEDTDPAELRLAFDVARSVIVAESASSSGERLSDDDLAARVLPPVAITKRSLDSGRRVVIGAGLNFSEHRVESGTTSLAEASDIVMFSKPVAPSGAYVPVPTGIAIGSDPPVPVRLIDYEVEIGLVFLDSIDLSQPVPERAALFESIAFFTANDISARAPIILDSEYGFTRGKTRPGYLPIGPWLVHGRDLDLAAGGEGSRALSMALSVGDDLADSTMRQSDSSANILLGPRRIIQELSRRYQEKEPLCMRDGLGRQYTLHDGHGSIPAGSLLLTGTPGGTALQSPGLFDRIRLFIKGGLSVAGARREFVKENLEDADRAYLRPGVWVETKVELLGSQRWTVVLSETAEPYGELGPGDCTAPREK